MEGMVRARPYSRKSASATVGETVIKTQQSVGKSSEAGNVLHAIIIRHLTLLNVDHRGMKAIVGLGCRRS